MAEDLPFVSLRPMTVPEFEIYSVYVTAEYADEVGRNTMVSADAARSRAERSMAEELPKGLHTPGQRLLIAEDADGERVGHLWLAHKPDTGMLFINDIEVEASDRGKGYGRRLLRLIEDEARESGVMRIELNVFADNGVARRLYETAGYHEMQRKMVKVLD